MQNIMEIYDKPIMVDPPQGYMYGFPKLYSRVENPNFYKWIVKEGYPQEEIKKYEGQFYCRFWYPEDENNRS